MASQRLRHASGMAEVSDANFDCETPGIKTDSLCGTAKSKLKHASGMQDVNDVNADGGTSDINPILDATLPNPH